MIDALGLPAVLAASLLFLVALVCTMVLMVDWLLTWSLRRKYRKLTGQHWPMKR